MRLLGVRQEQIAVVNNLLYPLYGDVRILRICHANCQKVCAEAQTFSLPLGALQITCQENWGGRQLLGVRV